MSLIQHNNFNQPNLNGLVDIDSDNITTNTISTAEIIINGENIVEDILQNKYKLTKIDYDDVTDTTEIDSNLSLTGNLLLDNVTISKDELKYLDGVTSNIQNQLNAEAGDISLLQQKTTKISYDSGTDTTTASSNLTVSGVLDIGNIKHTPGTNYIIENSISAGSLTLRHKDFQSVIRTMTIDQFINVNGINDLRINKLFVGGTQINFNTYNTTVANTQKITYNAGTNMTNILSKVTLYDTVDVYGDTTYLNNVYFYDNVEIGGAAVFKLGNITHTKGTNYIIENSTLSGTFQIRHKDFNSVVRSLTIDEFINMSGINDLLINNRLFIGGNQINFNAYNDAVTKTTKLSYDGVTDTTNFISKTNFNDNAFFNAGVTIGQDLNTLKYISSFNADAGMRYENKINNYYTNFSQRNTSGIDSTVLRLHHSKIDSLIGHDFTGQTNFNNTATFNNGITMTSNLNQSSAAIITQETVGSTGVNTFKGSNFFGAIAFTSTDPVQNKIFQPLTAGDVTGQPNNFKYSFMRYTSTGGTSNFGLLTLLETVSLNQFAFFPSLGNGAFNSIVDNQSRTLLANGAGSQNNCSLVFTCWSTTRVGLKVKATPTGNSCELWAGNLSNLIMNSNTGTTMGNVDRIGFKDGTNQTTAMTDSYIQSIVNAMSSVLNPPGIINQYAGSVAPSGWLLCHGQLISKTTYSALWIVIGDTYLNGRSPNANNFYIPDLREMYIKGAGQNFTYTKRYTYSGGNPLGAFLDQEVLPHYHQYTDKGDGSVSRTPGSNNCANNNQRTNNSDFVPYHPDGTPMTNNENRPQTIVLNYIIKV